MTEKQKAISPELNESIERARMWPDFPQFTKIQTSLVSQVWCRVAGWEVKNEIWKRVHERQIATERSQRRGVVRYH